MIHLMNSAIMTTPGIYKAEKLAQEEFARLVKEAYQNKAIISHLGYPQAIFFVASLTGITFEINRDRTDFIDGDEALILRLAYRIPDPSTKGKHQRENYEFLRTVFTSEKGDSNGKSAQI